MNPHSRLQSDYLPGPQPNLLGEEFGFMLGPTPAGSLVCSHISTALDKRQQLLSLAIIYTQSGHQQVSLVHLLSPVSYHTARLSAAELKQSSLPFPKVKFLGKSSSLAKEESSPTPSEGHFVWGALSDNHHL